MSWSRIMWMSKKDITNNLKRLEDDSFVPNETKEIGNGME